MRILFEMAGGMGDEICTIPTVKYVSNQFPEARITLKYRFRELFLGNDFIHDFARSDSDIARGEFDKTYMFRWAVGDLTYLNSQHLVDVFALQKKITLEDRSINYIKLFDDELERFSFLKQDKRPVICFDVFASVRANRWSSKRFRAVVKQLEEEHNALIVQIGGKKGEYLGIGRSALDLPIRDMASVIANSDLYIGNNSGAAHLASALKIPSVKIFSATNPRMYVHDYNLEKVVYSTVECSGCLNNRPGKNPLMKKQYKCPVGDWFCKDMIMVDDVYRACEEQLNKFFYKR
jgi:ADP-heptose:LPS heptosyltransferase